PNTRHLPASGSLLPTGIRGVESMQGYRTCFSGFSPTSAVYGVPVRTVLSLPVPSVQYHRFLPGHKIDISIAVLSATCFFPRNFSSLWTGNRLLGRFAVSSSPNRRYRNPTPDCFHLWQPYISLQFPDPEDISGRSAHPHISAYTFVSLPVSSVLPILPAV